MVARARSKCGLGSDQRTPQSSLSETLPTINSPFMEKDNALFTVRIQLHGGKKYEAVKVDRNCRRLPGCGSLSARLGHRPSSAKTACSTSGRFELRRGPGFH